MSKIMLVEDEADLNNCIVQLLTRHMPQSAATEIISCGSFVCAAEKWKEEKDTINLVITDSGHVNGGVGGGAKLIKQIWKDEENIAVPDKTKVIVITGDKDGFRKINPDMDSVLVLAKPFNVKDFLATVKNEMGGFFTKIERRVPQQNLALG